ncbi:hypothetical protein EVA_12427 [gut metagenome]|uniref:Uncharacterized protein n=1 Tax=gut metagenome TaxID=749906 RepID=J9GCF0_9ZZZZ
MKLKFLIIITFIPTMWFCMDGGGLPFWKAFLFYLFLLPFVVWLYDATRELEDESSIEILVRLLSRLKSKDSKDTQDAEAKKEAQEETITLEKLEIESEGAEVSIVQVDAEGDSEDISDDEDLSDDEDTVVKEYLVRIKVKVTSKDSKRPVDESPSTDSGTPTDSGKD